MGIVYKIMELNSFDFVVQQMLLVTTGLIRLLYLLSTPVGSCTMRKCQKLSEMNILFEN
jgi:hypothetical protein